MRAKLVRLGDASLASRKVERRKTGVSGFGNGGFSTGNQRLRAIEGLIISLAGSAGRDTLEAYLLLRTGAPTLPKATR
jgi:hypothetical protein